MIILFTTSTTFLHCLQFLKGVYNFFNTFFFLVQAYEWALEAMKYMSRVKPEDVQHPGQSIKQLRQYLMAHPSPATEHFAEMVQLAQKLGNEKLLEQCKVRISRK